MLTVLVYRVGAGCSTPCVPLRGLSPRQAAVLVQPPSTPAITIIVADVVVAKGNTKLFVHVARSSEVPTQIEERTGEGEFHWGDPDDSINIQPTRPTWKPLCATSETVQDTQASGISNVLGRAPGLGIKKGLIEPPNYTLFPVTVVIVILEFRLTFIPC